MLRAPFFVCHPRRNEAQRNEERGPCGFWAHTRHEVPALRFA
jgi:hypothetical protein